MASPLPSLYRLGGEQQDDDSNTLNGDNVRPHPKPTYATAGPSTMKPDPQQDKGILRGREHSSDHPFLPHGQAELAAPFQHHPSIVFVEPPRGMNTRQPRIVRARSPTDDLPEAQEATPAMVPLVFAKRPTLRSGRSSFSCSTCGSSAPMSPVSGDEVTRFANVQGARTPSLSRSETECSEEGQHHRRMTSHPCCAHPQLWMMNDDQQPPQQPVSLLSAAFLAGGQYSPRKERQSNGILRREAATSQDSHNVFEADSDEATRAPERAAQHTRFVEPPKPVRASSRRASLSPRRAAPCVCASPDHFSEGPLVSPRRSMLLSPSQDHSASTSPRMQRTDSNTAVDLPKPRRLTFQDADGVKERAQAREEAAAAARAANEDQRVDEAEAGPSRKPSSSRTTSEDLPKVHPCDLSPPSRTQSPFAVAALPRQLSKSVLEASQAMQSPVPRVRSRSKLTFAASPSELKGLRRGRSGGPTSSGGSLRRAGKARLSTTPPSSDDERPYVDTVATGRIPATAYSPAPPSKTSAGAKQLRRGRRGGSPAPKHLGGPEASRRTRDGQGRARSPAPRGRINIPESFDSVNTDEDDDVNRSLDYEEDDEEDSQEDDEEDDEDEIESDEADQSATEADNGHSGASLEEPSGSPPAAIVAGQAIPRPRPSSPHPSVDSESHPAAFSNSDFEEESNDAAVARAFIDAHSSTQPGSSDWSTSAAGASPLPFARSRQQSSALSDGEWFTSGRRSSYSRAGASPAGVGSFHASRPRHRPSVSPVPPPRIRSRSSNLLLRGSKQYASVVSSQPSTTTTSPLDAHRQSDQANPGSRPVTPRSFSATSMARCLPSLGACSEQAQAQSMSSTSHHQLNSTVDHRPGQLCSGQSPDAWTALRSCLEAAVSDGDVPRRGPSRSFVAGADHRRPWFSNFSTPNDPRTFSPSASPPQYRRGSSHLHEHVSMDSPLEGLSDVEEPQRM